MNGNRHLGLTLDFRLFFPVGQINRVPECGELRECTTEVEDAILPRTRIIQRNSLMATVAKDRLDQTTQDAFRSHFEERPHTAGVHRFDLFFETNRRIKLTRKDIERRVFRFRINPARTIGEDFDRTVVKLDAVEKPAEFDRRVAHQLAMESSRHVELGNPPPMLATGL